VLVKNRQKCCTADFFVKVQNIDSTAEKVLKIWTSFVIYKTTAQRKQIAQGANIRLIRSPWFASAEENIKKGQDSIRLQRHALKV
jgi:hypothetical protein